MKHKQRKPLTIQSDPTNKTDTFVVDENSGFIKVTSDFPGDKVFIRKDRFADIVAIAVEGEGEDGPAIVLHCSSGTEICIPFDKRSKASKAANQLAAKLAGTELKENEPTEQSEDVTAS